MHIKQPIRGKKNWALQCTILTLVSGGCTDKKIHNAQLLNKAVAANSGAPVR
jgi:hypothetical protein